MIIDDIFIFRKLIKKKDYKNIKLYQETNVFTKGRMSHLFKNEEECLSHYVRFVRNVWSVDAYLMVKDHYTNTNQCNQNSHQEKHTSGAYFECGG